MALTTPLAAPQISDTAYAAAKAAYAVDAAIAVTNAANMTPAPDQSVDEVAMMQELTIVAATMVALNSGAPVEPAVATEATRRYQDAIATITAPQPGPQPTPPPVFPAPTVTLPQPPALPDLQSIPIAPAPGALAGARLPNMREEVEAMLGRLTGSVAGAERMTSASPEPLPGLLIAYFGEMLMENGDRAARMSVNAQDLALAAGGLPPGWTAAHVVVRYSEQFPGVVGQGRDGQLYWVHLALNLSSDSSRPPEHSLLLGDEMSTWRFVLTAPTTEELDALVAAFAEAL